MATVFLILSAILFIVTFIIDSMIANQKFDKPMYLYNPLLAIIPIISGFILPVIPLTVVFKISWVAIFFINIAAVYTIGPMLARAYLVRFSSGKALGRDLVTAFFGGIILLAIGLIIN